MIQELLIYIAKDLTLSAASAPSLILPPWMSQAVNVKFDLAFWETILCLQIGSELRAGTEQVFSTEMWKQATLPRILFILTLSKQVCWLFFPKSIKGFSQFFKNTTLKIVITMWFCRK